MDKNTKVEPTENEQINNTLEEIKLRDEAKDTTLLTRGILLILGAFLTGLFIGDFFFKTDYLTPEIIHTVFGFIGGVLTMIVNSHFQKKGTTMNQNGTNGTNGTNGQKPHGRNV